MKNWVWIVILIVITLGGYVWGFIQFNKTSSLEQQLIREDLGNIGLIDDQLKDIRKDKKLTLEELEKSKERVIKLIDAAKLKDTTELSLDDALKLIEGI